MQKIENKIIFLSPLDWGMGHATRCLPIIEMLGKKNKIILGVTKVNSLFFELHFPQLQRINMPSYGIQYSKHLPFFLKLFLQFPRILFVIRKEKRKLHTLISRYQINLVISDNRFGCYSNQVESVLITHQLNLQTAVFSKLANTINQWFIHHYSEVWVPDFAETEKRLSGKLSDYSDINIPVIFIGPLSALEKFVSSSESISIDVLILLSGVEPQRSILETELLKNEGLQQKKIVLVRGSSIRSKGFPDSFKVFDFVFGQNLAELIAQANLVVCRSGYSTLMDMYLLNKEKLILIPTPGQTEQEYLAEHWLQRFQARVCLQSKLKGIEF